MRGAVAGSGLSPAKARGAAILAMVMVVVSACASPDQSGCPGTRRVLEVGFYAHFKPVSYSAAARSDDAAFDVHLGYESDLLTALEAMDDTNLTFERRALQPWDGIWLQPVRGGFDIVGGGITILDSRTRDGAGNVVVTFTKGHITFGQSLLVRAEDAQRFPTHSDLNADVVIGALPGTTGEARLLVLTGITNESGILTEGVRIETPSGPVTADGTDAFFIHAAGASPGLEHRSYLHPASERMPQVLYLGDEQGEAELIAALLEGRIDGVARGVIGNTDAADASGGALAVTAVDKASEERGGFTVAADDAELIRCLNARIEWLTDGNRIDFLDWRADPTVFMTRAQLWNEPN